MPRWLVWAQDWEESERGWGVRPDGFTLHATQESVKQRIKDLQASYTAPVAPDEYTRTSGDAFEVILTDPALITKVQETPEGVWGNGNHCRLKPVKGTAAMHRYDAEETAAAAAVPTPPWEELIITIDVMHSMLEMGKGKKVVMSEPQIQAALRWGLLETIPPPDPSRQPVQLQLSHFGWLWVHWKRRQVWKIRNGGRGNELKGPLLESGLEALLPE